MFALRPCKPYLSQPIARSKYQVRRPGPTVITCVVLLAIAIAAGTPTSFRVFAPLLTKVNASSASTALILSRRSGRFSMRWRRCKGVLDHIVDIGNRDGEAQESSLSRYELHLKLRDQAAGMPFVGSLTIVNTKGKVINFSRQWPVPGIDVTDRDFFKALSTSSDIESFIGPPVRSRVNESQVMHLARQITGPGGEFRGLISERWS
jgi:hypothetical protein